MNHEQGNKPKVLVLSIGGPFLSGKTNLAKQLASQASRKAKIVSLDDILIESLPDEKRKSIRTIADRYDQLLQLSQHDLESLQKKVREELRKFTLNVSLSESRRLRSSSMTHEEAAPLMPILILEGFATFSDPVYPMADIRVFLNTDLELIHHRYEDSGDPISEEMMAVLKSSTADFTTAFDNFLHNKTDISCNFEFLNDHSDMALLSDAIDKWRENDLMSTSDFGSRRSSQAQSDNQVSPEVAQNGNVAASSARFEDSKISFEDTRDLLMNHELNQNSPDNALLVYENRQLRLLLQQRDTEITELHKALSILQYKVPVMKAATEAKLKMKLEKAENRLIQCERLLDRYHSLIKEFSELFKPLLQGEIESQLEEYDKYAHGGEPDDLGFHQRQDMTQVSSLISPNKLGNTASDNGLHNHDTSIFKGSGLGSPISLSRVEDVHADSHIVRSSKSTRESDGHDHHGSRSYDCVTTRTIENFGKLLLKRKLEDDKFLQNLDPKKSKKMLCIEFPSSKENMILSKVNKHYLIDPTLKVNLINFSQKSLDVLHRLYPISVHSGTIFTGSHSSSGAPSSGNNVARSYVKRPNISPLRGSGARTHRSSGESNGGSSISSLPNSARGQPQSGLSRFSENAHSSGTLISSGTKGSHRRTRSNVVSSGMNPKI